MDSSRVFSHLLLLAAVLIPQAALSRVGLGDVVAESPDLMGSSLWQELWGVTGQGVQVAIVDSDFAQYTASQLAGEVPAPAGTCNRTPDPIEDIVSDHGTMVAQVLADNAPNVEIFLIKINSASGLNLSLPCSGTNPSVTLGQFLNNNGIDIVVMSLSFITGAYFDGSHPVDQLLAGEKARGRLWFTSAGNYAESHYEATPSGFHSEEFTMTEGTEFRIYVIWDQYGALQSNYLAEVYDKNNTRIWPPVPQSPPAYPHRVVPSPTGYLTFNPANGPYRIEIDLVFGPMAPLTMLCVAPSGDGHCKFLNHTRSASMFNGQQNAGAVVVTGIDKDHWSSPVQQVYSEGPTETTPVLSKPDIASPTGVSTTTGRKFGTSFSAPAAAGLAALAKEVVPSFTPTDLHLFMIDAVIDEGAVGYDYVYGYGKSSVSSLPGPWIVPDRDGDTITDFSDNCPDKQNANQVNTDGDQDGDVCDNRCDSLGTFTSITPDSYSGQVGAIGFLWGTGFGANAFVLFDNVQQATTIEVTEYPQGEFISFTVPGLTHGAHAVSVVNPEGCRSQDVVNFEITTGGGGGCGLLGLEAILAVIGARWVSRRRRIRS